MKGNMQFLHNQNLRWVMSTIFYYKRYFLEVVVAAGIFQLLAIVMPVVTQVIFDKVLVNKGVVTLDVLALGLLVVILFQFFMDSSKRILFAHMVSKIELLLGTRLMRQILQLPLDFFQRRRIGNIMMKFYALDNIRQFLTKTIIGAGLDLLFTVAFFAVMLPFSWRCSRNSQICV